MVLTQALGILLEEFLIRNRLLGRKFVVYRGSKKKESLSVYEQYEYLYFLLAELRSDEDTQGHLQRSIAQYFLTNNTLISFSVGIIVSIILAFISNDPDYTLPTIYYTSFLLFLLIISYAVAVIRFREMAKSIYSARMARAQND
jgi:hypothetical protein